MAKTLLQIRTQVKASHHLFTNTNLFPPAAVDFAINKVVAEIIDEIYDYNRRYLLASASLDIVASTITVALPADFKTLFDAYYDNGSSKMKLARVKRFDELDISTEGTPSHYYCPGDSEIYLQAVPSASLEDGLLIYYGKGATDMVKDDDEMTLSDSWFSLVVEGAKIELFMSEEVPVNGLYQVYRNKLMAKFNMLNAPVTGDAGQNQYWR